MAAATAVVLLGAASLARAQGAGAGGLGPGSGPWVVSRPEAVGLDPALVARADAEVEGIAKRYCFVLVKDGLIVHERYYGGSAQDDTHTAYSTGKTMASAAVGVAVTQGLLDLDRPVAEYGVEPRADFGPYWPRVTTRHLLSQTSGEGRYEPGTEFLYDSGQWINHISYVLDKVTGGTGTGRWATANLADKLGAPGWWAGQQGDINVGGSQPTTCRELARLGQLMLNKGAWPAQDGTVEQLVSLDYMGQMQSPAFPAVNYAQGLLTWLNRPARAPEFWKRATCPNVYSEGFPIGTLGFSAGAPEDVAVAMGYMGQYAIAIPSHGMVAVTMGSTYEGSLACMPYDSHHLLTKFWTAFGFAIGAPRNSTHATGTHAHGGGGSGNATLRGRA